ncbi:putative reverse transcriptase domain-containing protein [Tanacetum coccineum]
MTKITQKKVAFEWGDKKEAAFQTLKTKLCSAPILALPQGAENFIVGAGNLHVYCDASHKGLGCGVDAKREWCLLGRFGGTTCMEPSIRELKLRVRALVMTISLDLPKQILNAQTKAQKPENLKNEDVGGMIRKDIPKEKLEPAPMEYLSLNWQELRCHVMVNLRTVLSTESHKFKILHPSGFDKIYTRHEEAILGIVQEITEKVIQIKQRMQAARDQQKSYANLKRKPMEFQVGDRVMLKVSPWKWVVRFGKWGKLNPRYVGPFKVLEKVGSVAYKLKLPQELSRVHNIFHVSNFKKCYSNEPLAVPLEGLHVDDKLYFMEEPIEIMDQEVKRLKQSRILIFKVRWNSRRGPEFTWEREDQFQKKYPHLFSKLYFVCSSALEPWGKGSSNGRRL